jgi:AraC-like DNA-binding protein
MLFLTHTPSAPLSSFIDMLWLWDREGPPAPFSKERIMPTGAMGLIFNLQEDQTRVYDRENTHLCRTFRGAVVIGAHSEFTVIDTAEQTVVMGVSFRPGGAFPFFRPPTGEFRDAHVALEDVWGSRADCLRTRILEADTPARKFAALESVLSAEVVRPMVRDRAVAHALEALTVRSHPGAVAQVTSATGLTAKRFIQRFTDEVGLTPKRFCRVRRFQRVLRRVHRAPSVDWSDIAMAAGYYDQAHFIHDFRAFSGLTPTAYMAQRGEHLNHVPLKA